MRGSLIIAAGLSFLFSGLGHAPLGRRRSAVVLMPVAHLNVISGRAFKVACDRRITRDSASSLAPHSTKPGITALWQVSARLEEEFDRWVELGLRCVDRRSLRLDIKIAVRTAPPMLLGR